MDVPGWVFIVALVLFTALTTVFLGRYMAGIYGEGKAPGDRFFLPIERFFYRICGIDPTVEQRWTGYAMALLAFSVVSVLFLYALLRLQAVLPLNPTGMPAVEPGVAFSTAVSFMTNTNWQSYAGEATMSHLSQFAGLVVQNFVSPAVGLAALVALVRGIARRRANTIGNFWVDMTRSVTRILLPLAFVFALVLASQGVIQNLDGFTEVTTLEGATQSVPGGPVASQIAIKQLGSNGGGFFNVNSAHPFENPNGLTNFLSTWALFSIAFASVDMYGRMVGNRRQGFALIAVMGVLLVFSIAINVWAEDAGNPGLSALGADQETASEAPGGNMEGKEVRFGPALSAVWAASTTATSNGSVNSMHDSNTPIGGLIPMINMKLGEITPGGLGVGLTGMLVFVFLTVFIAGLMVGRTPEYLGKKIHAPEVKLVVLYILAMPFVVLGFSAAGVLLPAGLEGQLNSGPHGLSEILYAFTSAGNNNGSAFAGLTSTNSFYSPALGLAMLVGRFFLIIPVLGIAGSLVRKQTVPASAGTFPTDRTLFAALLIGVILVVAGLTFFPVWALGPIGEHLSL
jgi:potassium-transporting ATPase potassium-binding subunit